MRLGYAASACLLWKHAALRSKNISCDRRSLLVARTLGLEMSSSFQALQRPCSVQTGLFHIQLAIIRGLNGSDTRTYHHITYKSPHHAYLGNAFTGTGYS